MKKLITIVLVCFASTGLFSQQTITDAQIVSATDTLLKTQKDPKAWQTLQEIARADTYAPNIRSRVMYLFAVRGLLQMNTNMFATVLQKLQTQYPKEGAALTERLTPADWLVPCQTCGGSGMKQVVSKNPQGATVRCLNCVGTGKIYQLSPSVNEQVSTLLSEIKALSTENIQFAEASKKALAEYNPPRRVTALQDIVKKFGHRTDLDEVKQALATVEAEIAKKEAADRKREAEIALRNQEDKDYQAICAALEYLPTSGIDVVTKEIDRFIQKYPTSAERVELEITKAKLETRKKVTGYIWMACYICGGLAAVGFIFTLIKGLFMGKKKETGPLAVPGLVEERESSDPLAGSFIVDDNPSKK
jgi:hypothetical protein